MHTTMQGQDNKTVAVSSSAGDVLVKVASTAEGLPTAPLSKDAVQEALVKAKEKAEDFIAAVEGDLDAIET